MKNATELRQQLADVFASLRAGETNHRDAAELANIAGKMISSAKVQLEYCQLRDEKPDIPFLMN